MMSDTIAAVATAQGRSAIGIIRLSGDRAIQTVNRVFRPKRGGDMTDIPSGKLIYGALLDKDGNTIDLCLCTVSRAPRSYTGEDTAELHCHGSPVVLAEGLTSVFRAGARQAEAGEFTKRAFLNGKMDLTGAEAVIDLIDAPTPAAARNASGQISGAIFTKAEGIYSDLSVISSHFGAFIDFPDDDIDDFTLEHYRDTLVSASEELSRLLDTFSRGKWMRDGIPCAIVGRPNVGKSSLLNALLGYDRAIVDSEAGTTRDTIEETAVLGDIPLRITDTAGLRNTGDRVERQGVIRAEKAADSAELVLGVFDGSRPPEEEDTRTVDLLRQSGHAIAVINKSDLPCILDPSLISGSWPVLRVSALTGEGIESLSDAVGSMFSQDSPTVQGGILTNARQAEEVRRARDAVNEALSALTTGVTPDAVLTLTEEAMEALASLTGKNVREDIVSGIFSRFCVGK